MMSRQQTAGGRRRTADSRLHFFTFHVSRFTFHVSRFTFHAKAEPILTTQIHSIDQVIQVLQEQLYVADRSLATALFLALKLKRPLFLEGEAGVGKTEIAKVVAQLLDRPLIRLQCYEGLDVNTAVYEWNHTRQMLQIRLLEASGNVQRDQVEEELFSEKFLLKRPLLQAIESRNGKAPVLLIDELDRADEEFEARSEDHNV